MLISRLLFEGFRSFLTNFWTNWGKSSLVTIILLSHLVIANAQTQYKIKKVAPNSITIDTTCQIMVWIERPEKEPVPPVVKFYLSNEILSAEKYTEDLYKVSLPELVQATYTLRLMVDETVKDTCSFDVVPTPDTVEKLFQYIEHQIQQHEQLLITYAQFYTQGSIQRVLATQHWFSLQEILKGIAYGYANLWYVSEINLADIDYYGVKRLEEFAQAGVINEETRKSLRRKLVELVTQSRRRIQNAYMDGLREFISEGLQKISPSLINWGVENFEQIFDRFRTLLESWSEAISEMVSDETTLTIERYTVADSVDELNKMHQEGIKNLETLHQHISEISKIFVKFVGYAFESSGFNENQYKDKVNTIAEKQMKELRSRIADQRGWIELEREFYQIYGPFAPGNKKRQHK